MKNKSIFEQQKQFFDLAGQGGSHNSIELYKDLVIEEYDEFIEVYEDYENRTSDKNQFIIELTKEAIDLIYVTLGFLHGLGVDADKAWDIVHESNMRKVDGSGAGTIVDADTGKVLKSVQWKIENKKIMYDKLNELIGVDKPEYKQLDLFND